MKPEELEEIKAVVQKGHEETVKAVREMFISVGINISDPIKVQGEMAFLSVITKLANGIVSKVIIGAIAVFGAIAIGWAALKKGG